MLAITSFCMLSVLKGKEIKGKLTSLRVDIIQWHLIQIIKLKSSDEIHNKQFLTTVPLKVHPLKIKWDYTELYPPLNQQ